jgi:Mrr N-terminal domain
MLSGCPVFRVLPDAPANAQSTSLPTKATATRVVEGCCEDVGSGTPSPSGATSGSHATFDNRVGWARTYLKKAALLESPRRGY